MSHSMSSWPFGSPDQLAEALRDQGAGPEELADLVPILGRLSEWRAPLPSPTETERLFILLASALPTPSPVRAAIRLHRQRQGTGIRWLLATACTQVSLFGPAFWLVSALVTCVGAVAVLSIDRAQPAQALVVQALMLRASGPLLAYLGTVIAFRGMQGRVLECELVCLPSPLQLALARLVIVLGYDIGLGLALSLMLALGGAGQVLSLILSWFMPLLLVAGLALLLSLRLSIPAAATLAYGSWLVLLVIQAASSLELVPVTPQAEALIGGLGLACLAIALLRLQANSHRLLPRT
jgi:hypothetical protein